MKKKSTHAKVAKIANDASKEKILYINNSPSLLMYLKEILTRL
jgi:hypothetical protein